MLDALIGPVTGLLDKFIPDADERNRLAHEIATMSERHAHELAKGQIEINKGGGDSPVHLCGGLASGNRLVLFSGLNVAFRFTAIGYFVIAYTGVNAPPLPEFDMDSLLTVLLGMLGLGGLRTFEKTKVSREK